MQSETLAPGTPRVVRIRGLSDYKTTLEAMREFTRARGPETRDEIWLLEHAPVFTLGLAGRRDHLLDPGDIPVVKTERGGQVTYHGPGQVIAYTLLDLHRLGIGARELVFRIEQAVIQTLSALGVPGERVAGAPGIYVRQAEMPMAAADALEARAAPRFHGLAKIGALGVKISRGCSFHGVALNVRMDLGPYRRIDPCGYPGLRTVDLASLGVDVGVDAVASLLGERLSAHFAGSTSARIGAHATPPPG